MQLMSSKASGGIRSLVCDRNGIVIAETVYRCMICSDVFAELEEIHMHYQLEHIEKEILPRSNQNAPKHPQVEVDFENDDFELSPLPTVNNNNSSVASSHFDHVNNGEVEGNRNTGSNKNGTSKGGFVTCEICSLTKYYSHISRRCGIFSCEACFKQFSRFLQKPVKYTCAGNNQCPLNIDLPGARCKSCLLDACFNKFKLDPKKHPKLFSKESAFFPVPNSQVAVQSNAVDVPNVSSGSDFSMLKVVSKSKAKSNKVRKEPIVPRLKGSRSLLSKRGPLSPVNSEEAEGERSSTVESKLMLPSLSQIFLPSAKKQKRKNDELPLLYGGGGATNQQRFSPSRQ